MAELEGQTLKDIIVFVFLHHGYNGALITLMTARRCRVLTSLFIIVTTRQHFRGVWGGASLAQSAFAEFFMFPPRVKEAWSTWMQGRMDENITAVSESDGAALLGTLAQLLY